MRNKIIACFITIIVSLFSSNSLAVEYLYKLSGGLNYWATANAYGNLGEYQLADGEHGINYHYNGTRLGFWVDAKSGIILLPNLKFRYQDIQFYGTGNINEILNIQIANIDLSSLLGEVESEINFSYIDAIASFNIPSDVVDLDLGVKLRVHAINYGIGPKDGTMDTNGFYIPIPFGYGGVSKSILDDNVSFHAEYSYLTFKGTQFEAIDLFARYKIPLDNVLPLVSANIQAGYQSFNFSIDADSDFNFFINEPGQFGFESIVIGASASF